MTRELTPCGTTGAYQRHLKAGEPVCAACQEAMRLYQLKRRGGYKLVQLRPCGTPSARQRHYKRGEPVCEECRAAYNAYQTRWRQERLAARIEQARAETVAAKQAA